MRPAIKFAKEYFKNKKVKCVEVGVEEGINAQEIIENLNIEKLHLIDIWEEYIAEGKKWNFSEDYEKIVDKFKNNKNVIIIKNSSLEEVKNFEDESLDFIYIDANHQYDYVKKDIEAWFKKIKKGGLLSGHDYEPTWLGVIKAVNEFSKRNNIKLNHIFPDWWIEK